MQIYNSEASSLPSAPLGYSAISKKLSVGEEEISVGTYAFIVEKWNLFFSFSKLVTLLQLKAMEHRDEDLVKKVIKDVEICYFNNYSHSETIPL